MNTRNAIISIDIILLILFSISAIFSNDPKNINNSIAIFCKSISPVLISIFGILSGYIIKNLIDEKNRKITLITEISNNSQLFQNFNNELRKTKKKWNNKNQAWIKKTEPVLYMSGRIFGTQYLSDNAFQSFLIAGFVESLPKELQYNLSIYYQHCREFSDFTQGLEVYINNWISEKKNEILPHKNPSPHNFYHADPEQKVPSTYQILADTLSESTIAPATYGTPFCIYPKANSRSFRNSYGEFPTMGTPTSYTGFEDQHLDYVSLPPIYSRVNIETKKTDYSTSMVKENAELNRFPSYSHEDEITKCYKIFDDLINKYEQFFKTEIMEINNFLLPPISCKNFSPSQLYRLP